MFQRVGGCAQIKAIESLWTSSSGNLAVTRDCGLRPVIGSDLTPPTQRSVAGERVEIPEAPSNQPMPVENQVAVLYAVTNGHIDDIPVGRVRLWSTASTKYLRAHHSGLAGGRGDQGSRVRTSLKQELVSGIAETTKVFQAENAPAGAV